MDILFQRGEATVADVRESMPDPPSYSAVRTHLRILEEKGHVKHDQDGPRYVFRPSMAKEKAKRRALHHLVQTFFNGSAEQAMAALLGDAPDLSEDELTRMQALIESARDDHTGEADE